MLGRTMHGIAVIALVTLSLPAAGASAGDEIVVVQPGDMLGTIARRFGVSVDTLKSWNRLDSDKIRIGQELVVRRATSETIAPVQKPPPPRDDGPRYKIRRGDTLGRLAQRFGTTIEELLRWNPEITPHRLRVNQEIRLPERRARVLHVVRRGESLRDVADRYEVSTRELRLWNESLGTALRMGEAIVLFSDAPPSRSESVGLPYNGSLREPERLLPHPAYVIRDPQRAYGTEETVTWLYEAFEEVHEKHGKGPRVRVHDISLPKGGSMNGHASHQSGRDVDVSLYRKRCKDRVCPFALLHPDEMDVERQWALLRHFLVRGRVEAIFLDYALQQPLYEQAKREGASEAQLREWFQFPRGVDNPKGVVRHYRNHRDHAHIRFVCPKTDAECVSR
jgi:LysM repeat protein/murein endopeptidase